MDALVGPLRRMVAAAAADHVVVFAAALAAFSAPADRSHGPVSETWPGSHRALPVLFASVPASLHTWHSLPLLPLSLGPPSPIPAMTNPRPTCHGPATHHSHCCCPGFATYCWHLATPAGFAALQALMLCWLVQAGVQTWRIVLVVGWSVVLHLLLVAFWVADPEARATMVLQVGHFTRSARTSIKSSAIERDDFP